MSWKKIIVFGLLGLVIAFLYVVMLMILESWTGRILVFVFTAITIPALFRKDPHEQQQDDMK